MRLPLRNLLVGPLLLALVGNGVAADAPRPFEFAWRATLELPAGAGMARAQLPAAALARLQSSDARDLRVFNASGEPVAFAVSGLGPQAAQPAASTQSYPAFGLFANVAGRAPAAGAVQVQIDEPDGRRSVWVRLDGGAKTGGNTSGSSAGVPVQSAIFSTRNEKQALAAITVQAELPANTPVLVTVATSPDLSTWSAVPVRGRLYRFEGAGAPANAALELEQPLRLEGLYLRLSWHGQEGVRVSAISGSVARPTPTPTPVRASLGAPVQTGRDTLEWTLAFATPLKALVLEAAQANTLVPVRVLGRLDAAQPWRELGQAVVYRLGSGDKESTNPPLALAHPSVRQLRVVAGNGLELSAANLQASAEFEPLQVVFLATGAAPFTLAAGRADTASTALAGATLASILPGKLDELPQARLGNVVLSERGQDQTPLGRLAAVLGGRSAVLWAVLVVGVLLLAGVAVALLRQLKQVAADSAGTKPR